MISIFEKYLSKQTQRTDLIEPAPSDTLNLVVIIPVYNEPDLHLCLQSLKLCNKTNKHIEVIILINHTDDTPDDIKIQNQDTYTKTIKWASLNNEASIKFYPVLVSDMQKKHAGVGMARKLAMDEAISRFSKINQANGIICSLDADTLVSNNYLTEIEKAFKLDSKLNVVLPSFEHRLTNDEAINNAICEYELHLRYFKLALKFTGFPFAYHTIGSAFAVNATAYVKQGGMNKKQGGEDFYFLQKIFHLNRSTELNQVTVFPSSRPSDRVPFGTGPAIRKIIDEGEFQTYQFVYFKYLNTFFSNVDSLFLANQSVIEAFYHQLHKSLKEFISVEEFTNRIIEIQNNSNSEITFVQRFYRWFDAFKIIKYLNFVHLSQKRIPVTDAVMQYLDQHGNANINSKNPNELLAILKNTEETT